MKNLNKRKLKLVEIQPLPPVIEISQLPQGRTHDTPYKKNELKYVYTAKMYKHILEVTLFDIAIGQAGLRMFFSKSNFITQMLGDEPKWSSATLKSLWYETCYLNSKRQINQRLYRRWFI